VQQRLQRPMIASQKHHLYTMLGIVVELLVSWLLLWVICKKHLGVLGFRPTKAGLPILVWDFCSPLFVARCTNL
jgi:NADH:ubiquinone oxidoreductase subunit 3 (subunit A)